MQFFQIIKTLKQSLLKPSFEFRPVEVRIVWFLTCFFLYQYNFTSKLALNKFKAYKGLIVVPSDKVNAIFGKSLQSDPLTVGMLRILASTNGLIYLQIWSFNVGWSSFPRIYNKKIISITITKLLRVGKGIKWIILTNRWKCVLQSSL